MSAHMLIVGRACRVRTAVAFTVLVFAGCDQTPPPPAPPPTPPPAPKMLRAAESPAFDTPAEAARAWHAAYRQEGYAGHERVTFHQSLTPVKPAKIQEVIDGLFSDIVAAEELQVLETMERDYYAAVIVRGGDQVGFLCLYNDGRGWHIPRSLVDLGSVFQRWGTAERGQDIKDRMAVAMIATAKAGHWAEGRDSSLPTVAAGGTLDSPAFDTPEAAVRAWVVTYREEGDAGHERLTFDETNVPPARWKSTLARRFQEAVQRTELEVVETIESPPLAAVIARLDGKLVELCLYRDRDGWHLSRTLVDWETVAGTGDYSKDDQLGDSIRDFAIGVSLKRLEQEKKE